MSLMTGASFDRHQLLQDEMSDLEIKTRRELEETSLREKELMEENKKTLADLER